MVKTKSSMKWLVLALSLILVIGAVVLTLTLRANAAEGYDTTFRVIITPSADNANAFARSQGWIGADETVRANASKQADTTDEPVFRFDNPQIFGVYGLSASETYTGDNRNLRKYLTDHSVSADKFDPEIRLYVLNDVIWCNDKKATISVLDTYQTLTNVAKNITAVPLTLHFIGVTDYNEGKMPTMYLNLNNSYTPVRCNFILDAVNLRGACKEGDADADNVVYHSGYTKEGAIATGRYTKEYVAAYYADGCTIEVKNGAGIFDGNAAGNATRLNRILVANYSNSYVSKTGTFINSAKGEQDTVGRLILRSGSYNIVQCGGLGKLGIKTTNMTANFPDEEYTDVENLKGYYYDYPDQAALDAGDRSDTSRWYEYDYNAGAADAYVTIGGDANGSESKVVSLYVGSVVGDIQTGAGATIHVNVEDGANVTTFRGDWIRGVRKGDSAKNIFSMYQFGDIDINVTGGKIGDFNGVGLGGIKNSSDTATIANNGYTGTSAPTYGQVHLYGDATVNFKGGTFTGSCYAVMNSDAYKSTEEYNSVVMHGNYTFNIGNADTGEGPTITSTTVRSGQGAQIFKDGSFTYNVYGGTIANHFYYGLSGMLYYTPEINILGGTVSEACWGFGASNTNTGADEVTEPFTGVTAPAAVKVTVDGATVGAYYGAKGGVTNQGTSFIDVSTISELKSGVIGKIYMLSDAAQSGRIGGADSNTPKVLNWITLGEENSAKTLTVGDYYAAGEFYPDVEGYNYRLGQGKLYGAQMVMATTVYDNLVLDPAAALTAVNDAGLKKAVYTVTVSGTSHSKSTLAWGTFEEGDFAGNFYALGKEANLDEGGFSGKYAVDCVLDVHGFDLETRANDHLFGNVVTRHKLTTDYAIGSVYVNIEGTEAQPLSITRLADPATVDPETQKVTVTDTDEGMILNNLTDTATVEYKNSSETRGNVVNPFLGDVNLSLKYVTLGEEGNQGYIHLMHSMQYRGAVNITLDHCTVNGTFHALSNAAYGEPSSMGAATAKTLAAVTTTLNDVSITRGYYGGAVNCYTCADITNILTDVTIGESYYGGGVRITNTVGADGTTDSRAGVWGVKASGSRSIGTIENTLTDVSIAANYGGGNQNAANYVGGVTNTLNDVVVGDAYYGACRASTTGSSVINNINGLDIVGYFYGGNESTGTINGTVTTTVTKFHSAKDQAEIGFYAGNSNGGTGTTINPATGEPAIVLTINPEKDEDVFFSGLISAGSSEGSVKGDIIVNLCGGVQHSTRHLILGNRQTSEGKIVTGNITCNVYGGSWGTVFLGGRNNTTAVTDPSTVGDVTLNLYGGSLFAVRKGYQDGKGCYVDGDTVVNIHTDSPADPAIVCDDLVIRNSIDAETQTYATDAEHPNTPYTVNVIAGDRTLYYGYNSYTYADGSVNTSVTNAFVIADTVTGTLKIAPADNYFYPVTCFEGGYHADATSKGVVAVGFEGAYQWSNGVRLTLKGVSDETMVQAANGTYSTIAYVQDGENATWVSADERPNVVYGTTIIMDAHFNVRVLFEKAKADSAANFAVSYAVNDGEAAAATLSSGTGDFADYYYFVVEGIPAAEYKSVKIAVTVTADGLQPRTTTLTGSKVLSDLAAMGENEALLSAAIGEYADALNAFVADQEIPAGTVADVTSDEINAMIAANSDKKVTAAVTDLAEGVKAVGVNLTVSDVVTLNYYLKLEDSAEITSAAVGTKTLNNGLTLTTKTVGEETYTVISVDCRADELATILSLTVNGGTEEFNACALSYAKALAEQDANLAQAVANYAYYVDKFAPIAA